MHKSREVRTKVRDFSQEIEGGFWEYNSGFQST